VSQPTPLPVTALRRSFERARCLSPVAQIQECVDRLVRPERVAALVLDAYRAIERGLAELEDEVPEPDEGARPATLVEQFFWKTRELIVHGDASFTCLATNVHPLGPLPSIGSGRTPERLSEGLDYVGLICDASSTLVLGVVQAPGDSTAYPLLLRLLACLTEMAPRAQRERMNHRHFLGVARESTRFDLNLVQWDRTDDPRTTPISQLTRDLAENVKRAIGESPDFPPILRDVVGLKMNPDRFDGRLRLDWRV
jgi:hypothetical protein